MASLPDSMFIDRAYFELFGRPADAGGKASWLAQLASGRSREEVYGSMANSAEFSQGSTDDRIRTLYRQVLGREAQGNEIAHWRGVATAQGFGTVATAVRYSAEGMRRQAGIASPGQSPPPAAPGATPPAPNAGDALARQSARDAVTAVLQRYGLSQLNDWAWSRIQQNASPQQIINELYDPSTEGGQVFAQRFPEFEQLRQRQNAGEQVYVPSVEEVLQLRNQYQEIMRSAGLPPQFYDQPSDFTGFIVNQRSPQEVAELVNEGFRRVTQAPVEVRDAMRDLYGVDGDGALAALFLDPTRAAPELLSMARTAEVEGTANRYGMGLGLQRAERVASLELSRQEVDQGFATLDNLAGLFTESIGEQVDLTAQDTGVDAVFGLAGGARDVLERRRAARINILSGGGGAIETRTGLGVGAAE